jgi:hypothetical protein
MPQANSESEREAQEQWELVNTPLGEAWSGRTRYAAAMYFYKRGELGPEVLEVYRLCSRLDHQDPLAIIRDRGAGRDWVRRVEAGRDP